jgi:hypothetical protein
MYKQMKLNSVLLGTLLLCATMTFAGQVFYSMDFDPPAMEMVDGHEIPAFNQGMLISPPGDPLVPRAAIILLLPPNEEAVDVQVTPLGRQVLPGQYYLSPAPQQYPLSYGPNVPATPENPDIYQRNAFYPASRIMDSQTQFLSGHGLAYVTLSPLEYNPVTGEVAYYSRIQVTVTTASTPRAQAAQALYRSTDKVKERVTSKVANPEDLAQYPNAEQDLEDVYQILLITPEAWVQYFQPWIDFKNACGMPVLVESSEDVLSQYQGVDDAEKIRNCIIDIYEQYATLEYVALGGDDEILEHRGLSFTGSETDHDIAADLYFAALDGNWNNNGNSWYGEPGEDDLVAELAVGRFPVDSPTEITNIVNKTLMYSREPVTADLEEALMVGEDLGWTPWGGDYKDEVMNGSSMWGYTTVGFPANFNVGTLYDRNGTWNPNQLIALLNGGLHLLNHLGHSDVTYNMKLYTSSINNSVMTNNGVNHNFYILYSQGCYSGSFDNRTTTGSYTNDCIGEDWAVIGNGAVAYVGNSRYGWGSGSNTNGASQRLDRQFFDALFAENIHRIGWTNGDSKEDNIGYINNDVVRWVYYEVNVLGDPTLDIWTATPETMNPTIPEEVLVQQASVPVDVPDEEGALIGITQNGMLIGRGVTDETGHADIVLDPPPETLDPLTFTITDHNYLPYQETVDVIAPEGPYILLGGYTLHDTTGNSNGALDFGETVTLDLEFDNVGTMPAENLTAELTADIRQATIIDGSVEIGNIQTGASSMMEDAFTFQVNPNIEDDETVVLTITISDIQDSIWIRHIELQSRAPDLALELIDLNGEGYGHLAVGETTTFDVTIHNAGSSATPDGQLIISTDTPYITMTANEASIGAIEPDASGTATSYTVEVSPSCPDPASVVLYFALSDPTLGYEGHTLTRMYVGGLFNNVEAGAGTWTHEAAPTWNDDWHISIDRNHSPSGQYSWKCGSGNGGQYRGHLDARLASPTINLSENSMLVFWHWMDAEISTTYPDSAYDGGVVEISVDGGEWTLLDPVEGYTHAIRYSAGGGTPYGGPFAGGTPCYSGQIPWSRATFDLSGYSGNAQIRFRFGSDNAVHMEGWYIDDVEIRPNEVPEAPQSLTASITAGRVDLSWSYAGYGLDQEGDLYFNIYRNDVKIDSMVDYHSYVDILDGQEAGTYAYYVTAQIDEIESGPSNLESVEYNGTAVENQDNLLIPNDFVLDQNYPNPFNPITTIRFGLPHEAHLTLKVYNILGQKVATLVDEVKPAGYHIIHWNADQLASGLYFTRMEAGSKILMTKMLLLK